MERTPLPQTGRKRPREESPESPPLRSEVPPIFTLRDTASPSVGPADPEHRPPKEENAWQVLCKTYPDIKQNPCELPPDPFLRLLGTTVPKNSLQRRGKQPFSTKRGMQNIRAALVQLCGNAVPEESCCTGCFRGNGHWWGCVITPSIPGLPEILEGACANCYYNGRGVFCSFRRGNFFHIYFSGLVLL